MRLSAARRVLCFTALAALASLAPSALAAPPLNPTVVKGTGTNNSGLFTAGPDGAEWLLPSGARLRFTANTMARVFPKAQSLDLGGGGKTPVWSLALLKGRVDVDVPAKPRNALLVQSDRVSAVVTQGDVGVIAANRDVFVANSNGAVRTYIDSRWTTVDKGHMSHIDPAHPGGLDSPLPPKPVFNRGPRMWLTAAEPAEVGGFSWQPVADATRYEVELRKADVVLTRQSVRTPSIAALAKVEPGEYVAVVRSVNANDIAGLWSEPRALRVVGIELPPGGYVENGGIFLSGGQQVKFSHTDGLEMTYIGAGKYVPASEAVGLYRNKRTIVSFRIPGSDEDTIARLEPRDVYAEVFAGPKLATWPKDPIELTVRVRTRAGAPAPAFLEVVPKVHVGIEPLEVSWHRQGSDLRATIPPQASQGPWVIRVDVTDQFGIQLGRDFVEVAEHRPKGPSKPASSASTTRSVQVASNGGGQKANP